MLRPGDAAPDFVLKDQDGKDLRLSGYSGKRIVLYFYHRDGNPGCTLEAKRFTDVYPEIEALDAVIVGVSMDEHGRHGAFASQHGIPFPLVSDPEGRVIDLYDAWRTSLLGRNHFGVRRCTYLIDEDGIIRRAYRGVNAVLHAPQVLRDLRRLMAQRSWGKANAKLKDLRP